MKKRKNKELEESNNIDNNLDSNEENKEENNDDKKEEVKKDTKLNIKKSIFYIFYEIIGFICLVLFALLFFDGPKDYIVDKTKYFFGIIILVYAILFLLPYTFKKKESFLITFITLIELILIGIICFILLCSDNKFFDIDRSFGLIIYLFGLTEIIRGYHSEGGVKLFKSSLLNGLIKYFNIFLITLGTYIFFSKPFGTNMVLALKITFITLAILSIIIGLLKIPKKKKSLL